MIKTFNTIEDIYENGIVEVDGKFICTVCKKEFKSLKVSINHYEKKNCHTTKQVFEGTLTEDKLYEMGKFIYATFDSVNNNKKARGLSKKQFDSNKSLYNFTGNLYLFSLSNSLTDIKDYFSFVVLLNCDKWRYLNQIYTISLSEEMLNLYYKDRRNSVREEDSAKFYDQHKTDLQDTSFILRTLERGDISISFFLSKMSDEHELYYSSFSDYEKEILGNLVSEYLTKVQNEHLL